MSNSVASIGVEAFFGCTSLTAITVDPLNSAYSSVAGVLFNKSQTTLIQFPEGKAGSYAIPNSVTSIGDSAFYGCRLTAVTIPSSATNIGDLAFGRSWLRGLYFFGNAPDIGYDVLYDESWGTVYYLAGTTGWGTTFGDLFTGWFPTMVWDGQTFPRIVENPQSATNLTGATASFSVTVTGIPPLSFQWQCNGTNIAQGSRISGAQANRLTLTNLQSQDYGFYTVLVTNAWGSVTSAPALLRVLSVEHLSLWVSNQIPARFDFTNAAWVEVAVVAPFPTPGSGTRWTAHRPVRCPSSTPTRSSSATRSWCRPLPTIRWMRRTWRWPRLQSSWTAFYLFATATAGGRVEPAGGLYLSNMVVTLTAKPDTGWEFLGWSGDASGTSTNLSVVVNRDKAVSAQFGLIPRFRLSVTTLGGGTVSGNTQSDYLRGTTVNLSATPEPGWYSELGRGRRGTSNSVSVGMDGDKSVVARFAPLTLLAVTAGGGQLSPIRRVTLCRIRTWC